MARRLEVVLVGDNTSLERAFSRSGRSATQFGRHVEESNHRVAHASKLGREAVTEASLVAGSQFGYLTRRAVSAGAAVAGTWGIFQGAKSAIEFTKELALETRHLNEITGMSTKESSRWAEAAHLRGIASRSLNVGFITLSRNIGQVGQADGQHAAQIEKATTAARQQQQAHAASANAAIHAAVARGESEKTVTAMVAKQQQAQQALVLKGQQKLGGLRKGSGKLSAFEELGISAAELKKLNVDQVIFRVSDAFKKLGPGADRARIAQKLFGRQAQTLIPLISEGSKKLRETLGLSDKYGTTLDRNQVKKAYEAVKAQRAFKASLDGIKVSVSELLLPALTKGEQGLADFNAQVSAIVRDPHLSDAQKFDRVVDLIVGKFEDAAPRVEHAFELVLPRIAEGFAHEAPRAALAFVHEAPRAALAFVHGFEGADIWGKLAIALFAGPKIARLLTQGKALGRLVGVKFAAGEAEGAAVSAPGVRAASAAGGLPVIAGGAPAGRSGARAKGWRGAPVMVTRWNTELAPRTAGWEEIQLPGRSVRSSALGRMESGYRYGGPVSQLGPRGSRLKSFAAGGAGLAAGILPALGIGLAVNTGFDIADLARGNSSFDLMSSLKRAQTKGGLLGMTSRGLGHLPGSHLLGGKSGEWLDEQKTAQRLEAIVKQIAVDHKGITRETADQAGRLSDQLGFSKQIRGELGQILHQGLKLGDPGAAITSILGEFKGKKKLSLGLAHQFVDELQKLPEQSRPAAAQAVLTIAAELKKTGQIKGSISQLRALIEGGVAGVGNISMHGPQSLVDKFGITMDQLVGAVQDPTSQMGHIVANALEAFGEGSSAQRVRAALHEQAAIKAIPTGSGRKQAHMRATGGVVPGGYSPVDNVFAMLRGDEEVLTPEVHSPMVNLAMAFANQMGVVPWGSTHEMFRATGAAYAQGGAVRRFAKGGAGPYVYPMGSGLALGRTDQGVDFSGKGPIATIGAATFTRVSPQGSNSGWPGAKGGGTGAMLVYRLDSGPEKGRFVFLAENVDPVRGLHTGSHLKAGSVFARARGSYPFLETGWSNAAGVPVAHAGYREGLATKAGKGFGAFISGLQHGKLIGAGARGGGGVDAPRVPPLRVSGSGPMHDLLAGALHLERRAANRFIDRRAGRSAGKQSAGGLGAVGPGSGAALMRSISKQRGWRFGDWWEVDRRETSHGRRLSNPTSSARLRGQFLDMNWGKYGPGSDPRQHPSMRQQIISMGDYIGSRYGNPTRARQFHDAHNYYRRGGAVTRAVRRLAKGGGSGIGVSPTDKKTLGKQKAKQIAQHQAELGGTRQDKLQFAVSQAELSGDQQAELRALLKLATYLAHKLHAERAMGHIVAAGTTADTLKSTRDQVKQLREALRQGPQKQLSDLGNWIQPALDRSDLGTSLAQLTPALGDDIAAGLHAISVSENIFKAAKQRKASPALLGQAAQGIRSALESVKSLIGGDADTRADKRKVTIAKGPEAAELKTLQAADQADQRAQEQKDADEQTRRARLSQDPKLIAEAQKNIDQLKRRWREEDLAASIQSQQDKVDEETDVFKGALDDQFAALIKHLGKGKGAYAKFVKDVQQILSPLGIEVGGAVPGPGAASAPRLPTGAGKGFLKGVPLITPGQRKLALGHRASGGVSRGEVDRVGEVGPEDVYLPPGARVVPASQSTRPLRPLEVHQHFYGDNDEDRAARRLARQLTHVGL